MAIKQYVGISRDHSGSMSSCKIAAMNDYNRLIQDIKEAAAAEKIDTIVSTVKNGVGSGAVEREVVNSSIERLQPLTSYKADGGGTPLWDSVGELIEMFQTVPDINDREVSFMIMVVTDGEENASRRWDAKRLASKIRELQNSDRWTFVFRVPRGAKSRLVRLLGVYEDNVIEWDAGSSKDLERTTAQTSVATRSYFTQRAKGMGSTQRFYTNMAAHSVNEVKQALVEVTDPTIKFFYINRDIDIKSAIEAWTQRPFSIGSAFYQLTKTEEVQDHKQIAIHDRVTGKIYAGRAARQLLGLPEYGTIKLSPGNNGQFDVFIQSTSVNRKLIAGTEVMYWPSQAR